MSARKHFPLMGEIYNFYTVISEEVLIRSGKVHFLVKCKCGKEEFKSAKNLKKGRTISCKSCSSKRTALVYGTPLNYKPEILGKTYYRYIKNGSVKRGIEFNITLEYIVELIKEQEYKCKLSGLEISLPVKVQMDYEACTASLDRINNNLGYIGGNVQWVHKDINRLKWAFDQDYFIYLCQQIGKNNEVVVAPKPSPE